MKGDNEIKEAVDIIKEKERKERLEKDTEKISDAIGLINDKLVKESEKPSGNKNKWYKAAAAAACFLLVGTIAISRLGIGKNPETDIPVEVNEDKTAEVAPGKDGKGDAESPVISADTTDPAGGSEASFDSAGSDGAEAGYGGEGIGNITGEPFVLTGARWNDNDNWPFLINLVNSGTITFPSFGIDPRNRIKVNVSGGGAPLFGETVELLDKEENVVFTARTDREGIAYLFVPEGAEASQVRCNGITESLTITEADPENSQGDPVIRTAEEISIETEKRAEAITDLQVMFIVDTTGSMGDELAYLQKDFAAIADDAGNSGITYSVNFYRDEGDEYVTRTNGFTDDIEEVKALLNKEYADGGGDTPEAVADILRDTITNNDLWSETSEKIAFLIFDAPPHYGTEGVIKEAIESAAERGIHMIPVVASNSERETELFGRAISIMTNGEYVFLTDDSGVGDSHLEPIVGDYNVELLHDIIVQIIEEYKI